jgi:hypothetical protein
VADVSPSAEVKAAIVAFYAACDGDSNAEHDAATDLAGGCGFS